MSVSRSGWSFLRRWWPVLAAAAVTVAVAVLERYYTGGPCEHDRYLCRYELKKAIDACAGRTWSLPAFIVDALRVRS